MLFIVIKFINCLADETVDCAVRWNRVNRHFNVIDVAGGNSAVGNAVLTNPHSGLDPPVV